MTIVDKIKDKIGMTDERMMRKIFVRFPDFTGDTSRQMTVQELKDNHSGCMLFDPKTSQQVDILDLRDLDRSIEEVVALPAIRGG